MRKLLHSLFAVLPIALAAFAATAQQAAIPPLIKVVVPFAPGAGTDVLARAVVAQLGTRLGTTVVIENRAGASGVIGVASVVRGPRDGSMLLFHSTSLVTTAATSTNQPYDVTTDLVPVAIVGDGPMLVGVSAQAGITTPAQLVASARANPERRTAGSGGVGSVGHLAAELLNDAAKVQIRHIPYKGAAPALVDVAAGTVDILIASYSTLAPQIRSGRVLPIAVTSLEPSTAYPGIPPMATAAPGYKASIWYAMFAPAGTPAALVNRLNREINEIANSGEVRTIVQADGAVPVLASPEELAQRVRQDYATWKRLATLKHISID